MMRFRLLSSLVVLLSATVPVGAQLRFDRLYYQQHENDSLGGTLQFTLFSSSFFRNNEYFSDLNVGYTLFGTQGISSLKYQAHPNISLSAGLYYRIDFGTKGIYKLAPYYRLQLSKSGFTLNFGNIDGQLNHRLPEPMFQMERFITHHLEQGAQLVIDRKKIWADTWVNWERQQYPLSSFQEIISGGHSSYTSLWSDEQNELSLPVQIMLRHYGGQIDTIIAPIITTTNAAAGLQFKHKLADSGSALKSIAINSQFHLYHAAGASDVFPFVDGWGVFSNLDISLGRFWKVNIGHWYAKNYYAPLGGHLFSSVSSNPLLPELTEANRHLITSGIAYQRRIWKTLQADVRVQPTWDVHNKQIQYSYSLFLTMQPSILLHRFRENTTW